MIRTVKVEAGEHSFIVRVDENISFFNNTWKRIEGNPRVCSLSGIWAIGTGQHNKHCLYLKDENNSNLLYFDELGKESGDRGIAKFLSAKLAIAKNTLLVWEITKVEKEWND